MENTDVIINSTQVTVEDAVVIVQGGVEVVRLDATYNFEGVPEEYHESIFALILRRNRLMMPTWDDMRIQKRRVDKYESRLAEHKKLPWYRRVFAKRPWLSDPENNK